MKDRPVDTKNTNYRKSGPEDEELPRITTNPNTGRRSGTAGQNKALIGQESGIKEERKSIKQLVFFEENGERRSKPNSSYSSAVKIRPIPGPENDVKMPISVSQSELKSSKRSHRRKIFNDEDEIPSQKFTTLINGAKSVKNIGYRTQNIPSNVFTKKQKVASYITPKTRIENQRSDKNLRKIGQKTPN